METTEQQVGLAADTYEYLLNVTIADGKYTVLWDAENGLCALRHGERWRDCTGDNLIFSLATEVQNLRDQLEAAKKTTETKEKEKHEDISKAV